MLVFSLTGSAWQSIYDKMYAHIMWVTVQTSDYKGRDQGIFALAICLSHNTPTIKVVLNSIQLAHHADCF